jgi:hypothetical protein
MSPSPPCAFSPRADPWGKRGPSVCRWFEQGASVRILAALGFCFRGNDGSFGNWLILLKSFSVRH